MKLAVTLLAKNEVDIIDANIAYHLGAGADFIVATDNGSTDGTLEILERYAQEGVLHLIREPSTDFRQGEWVTRMARLAAGRGADWVINADADEFWWPRAGNLKEALERLPERYGVVHGVWRPFVARPDDGSHFAERMTTRLSMQAAINDPTNPFRPARKAMHRAHPGVRVRDGNHDVEGASLVTLHGWYPLEVFHIPLRSRDQVETKYTSGARRGLRFVPDEERLDAAADPLVVDDAELERGLAENLLVEDTRLRDALRSLAGTDSLAKRPEFGRLALTFSRPSVVDDALFAVEAAVVAQADDVRVRRQVDDLERRVQTLESQVGVRLQRLAERLLRRRTS
jgi:glycosyltransferase involved in cell wall biosynthesis